MRDWKRSLCIGILGVVSWSVFGASGCAGILEAYPVVAKDSEVEAPVAHEITGKDCPENEECEE